MKVFLLIIVLVFNFQFSSNANDIMEFQIENMSVGDSLLKYLNKNEIQNSKRNYTSGKNYYVIGVKHNLSTYDAVDIYLKTDDDKFIIRTLGGMIFSDNLNECLNKKDQISKDLNVLFPNIKMKEINGVHPYDASGKSKMYQSQFVLNELKDHIRIDCVTWSEKIKKEKNFTNYLAVIAMTSEINNWIDEGYN